MQIKIVISEYSTICTVANLVNTPSSSSYDADPVNYYSKPRPILFILRI